MLDPSFGRPEPIPAAKAAADRHVWDIVPVRDVAWLGLTALALWFGYELRGVFTPLLIALLFAYLVNPLVRRAERRWRLPRPLTASLILVVTAAAGAMLVVWLGPLVSEQVQTLAKKIPQYVQRLSDRYGIVSGLSDNLRGLLDRFANDPPSVIQPLFFGTTKAFGVIGQVIGTTTEVVLFVMLIPLYFFLLAWHLDRMAERLTRLLPVSKREEVLRILGRMDQAVSGFFRGRLIIAILTAVMYAAGWAMAGVPYWFLLGLITGFLTIIPYVSVVGWPLAILLKYLDVVTGSGDFSWLAVVIWPSLPYLGVQFIESWMLTPWIQSQSMDMSALTVLIVVFVGGAIGGFSGLLLAIPVAACMKILGQELVLPRWERWATSH